ncbi:myrosinase 1-like [Leguminivora glycinivorella]|uniref:myrosinase 1-like n=1 Tax=Leguminivora glycinivorella TaxID=1035111 RepID=UPI00200EE2B8|nr:myrosinase 1-like [Leguminivora glycinivorella]
MNRTRLYILSLILALVAEIACQSFPPEFQFGVATSSYQIEGAWNVSDKGESIWDHLLHIRPDIIADLSNGDVACDSYHLWKQDIDLIADMGLDFYRFSINWPRLLPTGFPNKVSEDGARYYGNLIDGLRARGIAPVVTLYHWELPQSLQDLGGWTNPLSVEWFADYARIVFTLFADRVDTWITINEPIFACESPYRGIVAPAIVSDVGALLCSKYIMLAHAAAYRVYDEEFKPQYGGQVSFAHHEFWFEPKTDKDQELTELARDYAFSRFSYPVYSTEGGWPPLLEAYMAEKSRIEGYTRSKLPAFTAEEIKLLKGTYDFFAINHYTSRTVRAALSGEEFGIFGIDGLDEIGAVLESKPEWGSALGWLKVNPEGIRHVLNRIKHQYGDLKVMITESGYSDDSDDLNDVGRIDYYKTYLEQVLLAINEDKVNVVGYTAWSLIDNFEWNSGYQSHFGLYAVDFSDPSRKRTAKASARYYESVARTKSLDVENLTAN